MRYPTGGHWYFLDALDATSQCFLDVLGGHGMHFAP